MGHPHIETHWTIPRRKVRAAVGMRLHFTAGSVLRLLTP
jgi:hypothetical protein